MFIYILLILVSLICAPLAKRRKEYYLTLVFFLLVLVSAFRGLDVGADTVNYCKLYQNIARAPFAKLSDMGVEVGFSIFCKLLSLISTDPRFFLIASSLLINYLVALFIYRTSNDVVMSTFLYMSMYVYLATFNAIREYMAIAIVLMAYVSLKRQKIVRALIITLIAASFHYVALFFLPLIFISKFKNNKKTIALVTMVLIVLSTLAETLVNFIINNVPKYRYYLYYDYFTEGKGLDINIIIYFAQFVALIFVFYNLSKLKSKPQKLLSANFEHSDAAVLSDLWLLNIIIMVSLALSIMGISIRLVHRVNYLFFFFMIIYIPKMLTFFKNKNKPLMQFLCIICLCIYYVLMMSHNNHYVVPYSFVFNFAW